MHCISIDENSASLETLNEELDNAVFDINTLNTQMDQVNQSLKNTGIDMDKLSNTIIAVSYTHLTLPTNREV